MAGLPDFSANDRERLTALGVVNAQIEQLRYARLHVRLVVSPPAARNDVVALLDDVAGMADKLLRKTSAIALRHDAAHATAHLLIEQGYFQARPDDDGAQSFHGLAPRLTALRDAASAASNTLPPTPSRHRTASPAPIRAIDDALRHGWSKEHGSNVYHANRAHGREVKVYPNGPQRKPYPVDFKPSAADGSAFRDIVGICYEAEGGNRDPLAAIKAYLQGKREQRKEAMAALEAGLASANKPEE